MGPTGGGPNFGQSEKVVPVEGEQCASMASCIRQLVFVGGPEISCSLGGQAIQAALLEDLGKDRRDVLIEIQLHERGTEVRSRTFPREVVPGLKFRISLYLGVDFLAVVIVVGKGVVNGGKAEVGKRRLQLFGREALMQDIADHNANGKAGAGNDWSSATDGWVASDVGVKHLRHI